MSLNPSDKNYKDKFQTPHSAPELYDYRRTDNRYIRGLSGDSQPILNANLDTNGNNLIFDDNTGFDDDSNNEYLRFQKNLNSRQLPRSNKRCNWW